MTTAWTCLGSATEPPCGAEGTYDHTAKTGASGPANKHTAETGHATNSHQREWEPAICGERETRPDGNYECVRPPVHPNEGHYMVRLVCREREAS